MTGSKSKNAKNQRKTVAKKIKKHKLGFIAIFSFAVIIALLSTNLWNNITNIGKKDDIIDSLTEDYNGRRIQNDALEERAKAPVDDEYIADIAKKNGLRDSDEILFYLISGD